MQFAPILPPVKPSTPAASNRTDGAQHTAYRVPEAMFKLRLLTRNINDDAENLLRFLYKGIIIKHNKTEPTYTKTSLFLCEKRRFLWPGLRKEGNLFKLAGPGGLAFFHLTKKEVSKWPMKK